MSVFSHAPYSVVSRRDMLTRTGMGFGAIGLTQLLGAEGPITSTARAASTLTPLAPKPPQFAPRARHVIHIFLNGGCSHIDSFDPKPALVKHAGKEIPNTLRTERKTGAALPSPYKFRQFGQSGIEV